MIDPSGDSVLPFEKGGRGGISGEFGQADAAQSPPTPLLQRGENPAPRIETVFRDIAATRMAGLPILNPDLDVAAVGFRHWQDAWYGVLVTPCFRNLIAVPDDAGELAALGSGTRRTRTLPSGEYEFLSAHEDALGAYWSASLVSPMSQFADMAGAVAVAEAVLETVFKPEPEAAVAQPDTPPASIQTRLELSVSRRGFFSALLPK